MNAFSRLTEYFTKFPGIGPRQAQRFAYFLAAQDPRYLDELSHAIAHIRQSIARCAKCKRLFTPRAADVSNCDICSDANRDASQLLVVAKDADLTAVEHTDTYRGTYFVLGGIIGALEEAPEKRIRIRELIDRVTDDTAITEIVLALPAHPDGDATADYVAATLADAAPQQAFRISKLGRGLSTGLELEYSDPETIQNAFRNRH